MKNKIEKSVLINETKPDIKNIDRIYFGNEFCENLIPTIVGLKNSYFFTKSQCKKFTFVTPFVTNAGLIKLESLLNFLNGQHDIEVVFNDWGVFKLIKEKFKNLKPVLGRLLTKQRRDPRMLKIFYGGCKYRTELSPDKKIKTILLFKKVPRALFKHYQSSVINLPLFQEFLLSQGIKRIEIDNLVWEMNIKVDKKIGVSIYLPYGYVATSRMCGKLTLTYAACKKECKQYFFKSEDESSHASFYGIGNSVFYKSKPPASKYLEKLGIDRIVYQPRLPY